MEFVFRKVIIEGVEPAYKFIGMSGVIENDKLPHSYCYEDGPHVRLNGIEDGVVYTDRIFDVERYLYPGDIISIDEYDTFVAIAHMAGERLYRLRLAEKWHGIDIVVV